MPIPQASRVTAATTSQLQAKRRAARSEISVCRCPRVMSFRAVTTSTSNDWH
jgi:hypothetical protein